MPILCSVTREHFASIDRAGRPYIMELVRYFHPATGRCIRTKGRVIPAIDPSAEFARRSHPPTFSPPPNR